MPTAQKQVTKHTPGPWGFTYDGCSDYSIGQANDPQSLPVCHMWNPKDDNALANARLIAAAPDMLLALKLDLAYHSRPFCHQSMPEFQAAGYTGSNEGKEMRAWLDARKDQAIARAERGTV